MECARQERNAYKAWAKNPSMVKQADDGGWPVDGAPRQLRRLQQGRTPNHGGLHAIGPRSVFVKVHVCSCPCTTLPTLKYVTQFFLVLGLKDQWLGSSASVPWPVHMFFTE